VRNPKKKPSQRDGSFRDPNPEEYQVSFTPKRPAAVLGLLVAFVAGCGGAAAAAHSGGSKTAPAAAKSHMHARHAPVAHQPPASRPATAPAPAGNPIPQGNGGDQDADNNGGPSDGDGNL
jgi:hypothetical protein